MISHLIYCFGDFDLLSNFVLLIESSKLLHMLELHELAVQRTVGEPHKQPAQYSAGPLSHAGVK